MKMNILFECSLLLCPYSELFWLAFFRTWIEYGEILRIFP